MTRGVDPADHHAGRVADGGHGRPDGRVRPGRDRPDLQHAGRHRPHRPRLQRARLRAPGSRRGRGQRGRRRRRLRGPRANRCAARLPRAVGRAAGSDRRRNDAADRRLARDPALGARRAAPAARHRRPVPRAVPVGAPSWAHHRRGRAPAAAERADHGAPRASRPAPTRPARSRRAPALRDPAVRPVGHVRGRPGDRGGPANRDRPATHRGRPGSGPGHRGNAVRLVGPGPGHAFLDAGRRDAAPRVDPGRGRALDRVPGPPGPGRGAQTARGSPARGDGGPRVPDTARHPFHGRGPARRRRRGHRHALSGHAPRGAPLAR